MIIPSSSIIPSTCATLSWLVLQEGSVQFLKGLEEYETPVWAPGMIGLNALALIYPPPDQEEPDEVM
jgi:hypothetical protein